jgi:hypothetical protein
VRKVVLRLKSHLHILVNIYRQIAPIHSVTPLGYLNFQRVHNPRHTKFQLLRARMSPVSRILLVAASIVAVTAQSWSFSDAILAVGPKGKLATSSFAYEKIGVICELIY